MTAHPARWLGVATLLAAAPLLWWGSVAQAQPAGAGQAVVFTGGCADRPDSPPGVTAEPPATTVAPGAELEFVNRIGHRATLLLDGEPAVDLPADGRVVVTFHGGPVEAAMEITCPRGELAATVTVSVEDEPADPRPTPSPPPTAAPSPGDLHTPQWTPPEGAATDQGQPAPLAGVGGGSGPNGLLALVATVCVAGVSAAAIRVVLAQRSTRLEPA
jgi:hypothetical protein